MAVNDPTKFRQIYNKENNILVEADYDNIILIDPNKVVDANNNVKDRYVQQENLVFYANLETQIIPRTKLAIGDSFDNPVYNSQIASLSSFPEDLKLNFLRPKGKKHLIQVGLMNTLEEVLDKVKELIKTLNTKLIKTEILFLNKKF